MGDHSRPCLHQTKSVPHSKHWTATVCIPRAVPPYCRRRFVALARGAPASLDHLGAREQCRRNFEAERPRGGQFYDQIELGRCSTGMSAGFAPQRPASPRMAHCEIPPFCDPGHIALPSDG